jgi:hypothetical protein
MTTLRANGTFGGLPIDMRSAEMRRRNQSLNVFLQKLSETQR